MPWVLAPQMVGFILLLQKSVFFPVCDGPSRRQEFCHCTDIASPSMLKHLLKGEGVSAEWQSRRRLVGPGFIGSLGRHFGQPMLQPIYRAIGQGTGKIRKHGVPARGQVSARARLPVAARWRLVLQGTAVRRQDKAPWLNQKQLWPFSPLSSVSLSPLNAPPPLPTGQRLAFSIGLDSSFGWFDTARKLPIGWFHGADKTRDLLGKSSRSEQNEGLAGESEVQEWGVAGPRMGDGGSSHDGPRPRRSGTWGSPWRRGLPRGPATRKQRRGTLPTARFKSTGPHVGQGKRYGQALRAGGLNRSGTDTAARSIYIPRYSAPAQQPGTPVRLFSG